MSAIELPAALQELSPKRALLEALKEKERRLRTRRFYSFYPDEGPLARVLYQRHLEFFRLGATVKTRCFMAANRVGKTEGGGGYEVTCHLTGLYPDWWEGHRFARGIDAWAAGETMETVRDIVQRKLLGPQHEEGTGLIPADLIEEVRYRPNTNGAADWARVKHRGGGSSLLGFKSYDQSRQSFQGTEKDLVWLDEESPEGVRAECLLRLMTRHGHLIETFSPLKGLTPVVMKYIGEAAPSSRSVKHADRAMVMAGWNDVPHLSADEKRRMLSESEPHLKRARSEGIPSLGAGAIYPVDEADIRVAPFEIPAFWPRAYGLDVGWKRTAAIWGALDRASDTLYLYSEHYRGETEPVVHAQAVKARGAWVPGVIDPAAKGRSQVDGAQLMMIYQNLGLDLDVADNSVEAGIYAVWTRLSTGRLKVFSSLTHWFAEYRVYRRDEKGRIVKENDHALDATRYLVLSGLAEAKATPVARAHAVATPQVADAVAGY